VTGCGADAVRVRPAAVAGRFYPADPAALAALVDGLLSNARPARTARPGTWPVALIAPHAGYRYSGAVTATAYAAVRQWAGEVSGVVILGPAHFAPLQGMAVPSVDAFATPLGPVAVDREARSRALPAVVVDDEPHAYEHAIETQLPFLLRCLRPGIRVLPVLVGAAPPAAVAALLSTVACDPGVLTVVSTDLSHYLSRAQAQERDARTAAGILAKDGDVLQPRDACGYHPLRGLLQFAAGRDLTVQLLQLATSADTGGDPDRVVGYGAFLLHVAEIIATSRSHGAAAAGDAPRRE
jgi:MEMO1 family protein